MTNMQSKQRYEIGMIDLFFMGRIIVLNIINHGIASGGNNKAGSALKEQAEHSFRSAANILYCLRLFRKPNSLMMLVSARAPVESIIKDLSEHFHLDNFSLAEVQQYLTQHYTKKNYKAAASIDL